MDCLFCQKNVKEIDFKNTDLLKKFISGLHRKVWSLFKKRFHLPRYNELPSIKFDDGLDFIRNLTIADMV